ncbi:MAG: filamentous hemagglutinin N-terminal domain-containing protein, partial [Calothrix sp. MO_167.B12]|nr:filamentous hemagglutinin N-terminal domain-containing protein [Calothrix sp. MO_167.B12]
MGLISLVKTIKLHIFIGAFATGILTSGIVLPAKAQVTSDGTTNTIVNSSGNNFIIINGIERGHNLFHSFSNFSVPNNGSARFDLVNTPNITTIFSRVTGGNVSNIDGLIQTLNSNNAVSLFLMNPNGIVFGQNAQLDIGGSFVGTTANSIQFTDGTEFSAVNPTANPLLTMSVPVGLQMGSNPASIVVRGNGHNLRNGGSPFAVTGTHDEPQISVKPDNNIALIGGKITLDGGLVVAENSNIELGAIGVENNNSLVSLNTTGTSWTFNYDNIDNFSPIQILQRSLLDTGGTNPGNINLTGSTIDVLDASFALIENRGTGNSGNINVNASERLTVSGFVTNQDGRAFSTLANYTSASGDAGNVTIDAPQIYVRDRSEIRSTTVSSGNGGEITLRASEFIQLDNSIVDSEGIAQGNSVIFATAFSSGNAGVINIFTPQLNLLAGSQIGNTTFNAGNSNDININTQRLFLQDKAAITSSASRASGKGGNIIINVTESVEMIGSSRDSTESVVIGASSIAGTGNAGSITINTPRLSLQQGAFIQSSTLGDGDGGSITINASESVELSGSRLHTFFGIQPSTIRSVGILRPEATRRIFRLPNQVNGASGTVTVNAPRIRVTDGADISVGHDSVGNAGNLEINADSIFLDNQGQITANTASGNGGNIDFNLQKILQMRRGGLINT